MSEEYLKVKAILEKYNQTHLLVSYNYLTPGQQKNLLNEIFNLDFEQATHLINSVVSKEDIEDISPIESINKENISCEDKTSADILGENILRNGEYALVTMAGGQGTRLGYNGPKGTYLLHLKSGDKYIFEIFVDSLKRAYEEYGVYIPWYIMTSRDNNEDTIRFFVTNHYFGYPKEKIYFFEQGELPITDISGDLVLESRDKVFMAADGNGGIFRALSKNNIIDNMKSEGIKWVLITGVDNILANVADKEYIGLVASSGKQNGVKSVEKKLPEERVGVFCKRNGKPGIVEYSEMDENMRYAKKKDGTLVYADANIVNHLLSIELLEKIQNARLPIHKAFKKMNYIDKEGNYVEAKSPNMYKYECFIFDYFNYVEDTVIYRVKREEEFAPVKNKEGTDSPETATKLYNALN